MKRELWIIAGAFLATISLTSASLRAGDDAAESKFLAQFEHWYAANPPSTSGPSPTDRALLESHKPIYYLGAAARDPVDFYASYIANGTLHDAQGRVIASSPDRATLNAHARDPSVRFIHDGPAAVPGPSAVYGRIDHDTMPFPDGPRDLIFLTYTLAFETSGLPFGLSSLQEFAARAVADPDDWHQLDHYINVTLVLDAIKPARQPVAAIFQHHNYLRTWRLGGADGPGRLAWPSSGRIEVDIALRSNEAYPHQAPAARWRCASFMEGSAARWLVTGRSKPLTAAEDVTEPTRRIDDLPLITLPPSDAFYTFRGALGASRQLPGRSGPPGADFNTLAGLKRPAVQLAVSYWYDGLDAYLDDIETAGKAAWEGNDVEIRPFLDRFHADWRGENGK
jgi:hypothetical protein